MSNKCDFDKAWIGKCGEPVTDHGKCVTHAPIKCASCGSSATHECAETGMFVCGELLCDDCEHTITASGTNGGIGFNAEPPPAGMKSHCRKSEQVYKPWYMEAQV